MDLESGDQVADGSARYPDMERLDNGNILITHSINAKHGIRAQIFNEAWVNLGG